jgi:hypothetical protein
LCAFPVSFIWTTCLDLHNLPDFTILQVELYKSWSACSFYILHFPFALFLSNRNTSWALNTLSHTSTNLRNYVMHIKQSVDFVIVGGENWKSLLYIKFNLFCTLLYRSGWYSMACHFTVWWMLFQRQHTWNVCLILNIYELVFVSSCKVKSILSNKQKKSATSEKLDMYCIITKQGWKCM